MELRDGGIVLRPWRAEDAPAVHAACQDEEILRWIPVIPRPYTLEHARAFASGELGLGPHQFAVTSRALRLICRYGLDRLGRRRLTSHLPHPDGRRRDSVMFSLLPGELRE